MRIVLFGGGLGTRVREYADHIPKPMIPTGYRPLVWHLMKYYARNSGTRTSSAAPALRRSAGEPRRLLSAARDSQMILPTFRDAFLRAAGEIGPNVARAGRRLRCRDVPSDLRRRPRPARYWTS